MGAGAELVWCEKMGLLTWTYNGLPGQARDVVDIVKWRRQVEESHVEILTRLQYNPYVAYELGHMSHAIIKMMDELVDLQEALNKSAHSPMHEPLVHKHNELVKTLQHVDFAIRAYAEQVATYESKVSLSLRIRAFNKKYKEKASV